MSIDSSIGAFSIYGNNTFSLLMVFAALALIQVIPKTADLYQNGTILNRITSKIHSGGIVSGL